MVSINVIQIQNVDFPYKYRSCVGQNIGMACMIMGMAYKIVDNNKLWPRLMSDPNIKCRRWLILDPINVILLLNVDLWKLIFQKVDKKSTFWDNVDIMLTFSNQVRWCWLFHYFLYLSRFYICFSDYHNPEVFFTD